MYKNILLFILLLFFCDSRAQDAQPEDFFHMMLKQAQNGNYAACVYVGSSYFTGDGGVEQNYSEAFKWYQKAALNGETPAFVWMGIMYYWGYGTTQDYSKSFMWLKKAAQLGNPLADHWLGQLYFKGLGTTQNDYKAFECFKSAVDGGEAHSLNWLGELYYDGRGTDKDYKKAFECFQKAANNGIELAYAWLGRMYYAGEGVTQNYSEAYKWTQKAVDKGIKDAYFVMGIMHYYGHGVQQDYSQAYKWLKMAAGYGVYNAYDILATMYAFGLGTTQNPTEAFKCAKIAADNGIITSYFKVGTMYNNGEGVKQNYQEAYKWIKKAAEAKDPYSYGALGIMYYQGIGTAIDLKEAYRIAKIGAEYKNPEAMALLARMYREGKGVSKSIIDSFIWQKKAAEKGFVPSFIWLGVMYEDGLGTSKDVNEAITWYKKAYDKDVPDAPLHLCIAYYTQKDYAEAKKWADKTINQKEYALVGYRILALLNMYGLGIPQNKNKAFELIAKAIDGAKQKGVPMPNTLDAEGELYLADNNISKAREIYNEILKETPDFYTQRETKLSKYMQEHKGGTADIDIPIANNISNHTFAAIIANEKYQMEKFVQYAENDGKIFAEYCKKTLGLPEKNVHFITNATLNNIKHETKWLKDIIAAYKGDAKVIFYYAGHGIPDEKNKSAYLLPVDGYGSDVTTGYSLEDLYKTLGSLPSKSVTVFLDACFSGAKRDGDMLASARGVAIKVKQSNPTGNMVVFTAAQGDETAYPYKEEGHGLFTYYLLKKLQETKGDVTLGELGEYIKTQVERQSIVVNGKLQSPTILPASSIGNDWKEWKLNK